MGIKIKKLENLIIFGCLSDTAILEDLSQKEINHLLYFAYENNKFTALHNLLPYWKNLDFNKGANLINCLVDRFTIKEVTLIKKIEEIGVQDDVLNFYQNTLNGMKGISNAGVKECVNVLTDLMDYKLKRNFSDKLDSKLSLDEQTKKMVKI